MVLLKRVWDENQFLIFMSNTITCYVISHLMKLQCEEKKKNFTLLIENPCPMILRAELHGLARPVAEWLERTLGFHRY